MREPARLQTAIELLDQIVDAAREGGASADRLVADGMKRRRYAGSKDRRAIRDYVYRAIRVAGPVPANGRAAMIALAQQDPALRELFDGSTHAPAPIRVDEKAAKGGLAPAWLVDRLAASGIQGDGAAALVDRAPLDVRVNTLKADRETLDLPQPGEVLAAPNALRFAAGTQVESWAALTQGLIEVQDCASQLACEAVAARAGETVIDLCAGAGGKTLALAASMANQGNLIAADTDRGRLARLAPRASRAGAVIAETVLLDPGRELAALGTFAGGVDAVLVDAPCSGTGTWRRNPESRWRLTPARLEGHTALQARLMDVAAGLVRPGGRLVYAVCSVLDEEGAGQIDAFLARHPGWRAEQLQLPLGRARGAGVRLTPADDRTDGFFIARISSPC